MLYGIKIEIEVGCYCGVLGKLQKDTHGGVGNPFIVGKVEKVKKALDEKLIKFKGKDTWYPVWRVSDFTFGGVWIPHPLFNGKRLLADNNRIYKKYFSKKK